MPRRKTARQVLARHRSVSAAASIVREHGGTCSRILGRRRRRPAQRRAFAEARPFRDRNCCDNCDDKQYNGDRCFARRWSHGAATAAAEGIPAGNTAGCRRATHSCCSSVYVWQVLQELCPPRSLESSRAHAHTGEALPMSGLLKGICTSRLVETPHSRP